VAIYLQYDYLTSSLAVLLLALSRALFSSGHHHL
jgi:hypothetical protein